MMTKLIREELVETIMTIIPSGSDYADVIWDIMEFQRSFDIQKNTTLQVRLLAEEVEEFISEIATKGITPNLLKELIDIAFVLEGLISMIEEKEEDVKTEVDLYFVLTSIKQFVAPIAVFAFTEDEIMRAWKEVCKSNMSKLDENGKVIRREDGKVLKGPNYVEADMAKIIYTEKILADLHENINVERSKEYWKAIEQTERDLADGFIGHVQLCEEIDELDKRYKMGRYAPRDYEFDE